MAEKSRDLECLPRYSRGAFSDESERKQNGEGRAHVCVHIYYVYYRAGQSIASLLNLTDLMVGRNGAAAKKKKRN